MPNLLQFDPSQFLGFFLIMARMSGVMIAAPVLGDETIPFQIKAFLTLMTALVFYPVVAQPFLPRDPGVITLFYLVLGEMVIGLLLGFSAKILLSGVEMAGEMAGFQMGIGMANVFDPTSGTQAPLMGRIMTVFATLIFVVMDGHLMFLQALAQSYDVVATGKLHMSKPLYDHVLGLMAQLFVVGLKVGAPLVVSLLAANFAIGLVARSVPQMNVFVVGVPFTILLGIMFFGLSFPFFARSIYWLVGEMEKAVYTTTKLMGG